MFTFNFSKNDQSSGNEETNKLEWLKSEEIKYSMQDEINHDVTNFSCLGTTIKHLDVKNVIDQLKENGCDNIITAENLHTDLIPANYEGGLKIWECTKDLLEFLITENIALRDTLSLDLGCGLGLLGVYCILNGGAVHFQDYNTEVLTNITIPNVQINLTSRSDDRLSKTRFFSGDWASFEELTRNEDKYDFIFTSETIYNPSNYQKLLSVFKSRLKQHGTVYLAAKTYYFGVGGGLRQFEDLVKSENVFNFRTCWTCTNGVKREILKLTFIS